MHQLLICVALCSLQLLTGQAHAEPATHTKLFDRMGGESVLRTVVDETIDRSATDPRTRRSFDGIKLAALKDSIYAQLCQLAAGPCEYEGETMKNAHRDAEISEAEFVSMVGILRQVLDQHVGTREKNELLRLLAPMKRDILHNPNETTATDAHQPPQ